jgi:hypothetical protein
MQMNRRLTNGLAWAGALLVVGVPAADFLSAQFLGDRSAPPSAQVAVVDPQTIAPVPAPHSQRPAPKPAEQVAAAPTPSAPAKPTANGNVVDKFVQSGKALPSYITEAPAPKPAQAAAQPAPAAPVAAPKPVQTAAVQPQPAPTLPIQQPAPATPPQNAAIAPAPIGPQLPAPAIPGTDPVQTAAIPPKVAPMPMPLSMRPAPVAVAAANPIVNQPRFSVNEPVFVPPSVQPIPPAEITAEDLEDWETGPLADFLARREAPRQAEAPSFDDSEEFFTEPAPRFPRRDRLVGPELFFYEQ